MKRYLALSLVIGLGWATVVGALEPPRVIELTDGSIPVDRAEWSPDGTQIAVTASDGVYVIKPHAGAQLRRITDFFVRYIHWISSTELIGTRGEKISSRPPVRIRKIFRINLSGEHELICQGNPLQQPFKTTTGRIWFDSIGVLKPAKITPLFKTTAAEPEFRLVNHYPPRFKKGGPEYTDTDLWLESIDGRTKKRVLKDVLFFGPRLSGDGSKIVGPTSDLEILVVSLDGEVLTRVKSKDHDPEDDLFPWVSEPELSPDNNLLLFTRVWDDRRKQDVVGSDIFLYDIKTGEEIQVTYDLAVVDKEIRFNNDGSMALSIGNNRLFLMLFK